VTEENKLQNFWEDPEKIKQYVDLRSLWNRYVDEAEPFRARVNDLIFKENELVRKKLKRIESWWYSFKNSLLPKFRAETNSLDEELRDINRLINIAKRLHEEKATKLKPIGDEINKMLGLK
jgi:hypothetical protein